MWWILYVLLLVIAFLLFRIWQELHQLAFDTAFNLTLAREIAFEKVLTKEEKERYHEAFKATKQKYPRYWEQER